jgi:hypothetical protein
MHEQELTHTSALLDLHLDVDHVTIVHRYCLLELKSAAVGWFFLSAQS